MEISPLVIANLSRWISHGVQPGHFLTAVLCNDLKGAVERADGENILVLPEIVLWLNKHAPFNCWGSTQAVNNWRLSKRRDFREQQGKFQELKYEP